MAPEVLDEILAAKPELRNIPTIADVSFGHTTPAFTFPIGGRGGIEAAHGEARIIVDRG